MSAKGAAAPAAVRELTLTRVFDAPRELVFEAWTDPTRMAQWWGPRGFTNPVCEMDVRPGGALRIVMRAPDGAEHPMTGVFREIVRPERLVFSIEVVDDGGRRLLDGVTTVTFAERGDKTELTVEARAVAVVADAAAMLDGMPAGWTQTLERLEAHMAHRRGKSDAIRSLLSAFRSNNRRVAEELLNDDFRFTSPYDDAIDKATWFERCWPSSERIRMQDIEKIFVQGDEAFVLYKCVTNEGNEFRNTEFFRFDGGRISQVGVYFGATYKDGNFAKGQ